MCNGLGCPSVTGSALGASNVGWWLFILFFFFSNEASLTMKQAVSHTHRSTAENIVL